MIKTLNPYPNPAKTAEIMSRYRPIAPKPETTPNPMTEGSSSLPKQSPYLRNLWPQLQARPTRTRKRGRTPFTLLPSTLKRQRTHILGYCSPPPCHVTSSPAKNLSLQGFPTPPLPLPHPNHGLGVLNRGMQNNNLITPGLVTLPLLPCSPGGPAPNLDSITTTMKPCGGGMIDLNTKLSVPEEIDLLQQLQKPVSNNVIQPHAVRPIGSSITVVCMREDTTLPPVARTPKGSREVEDQAESEALPVVISDSQHRVRMANSAYKEMVGEPVCPWLDATVTAGGSGNMQCKRISGEVALNLCGSNIPTSANGFSCWVRIEWPSEQKKCCVNAFSEVMKLTCESRDYLFTWRFHTRRTREAPQSSCTA
ncbi:hypothetical protein DEO72_LG7g319 [Vigna unguiculata]|uniref:DUF7950 domain-containing protein n=1 Tax=Vigna unguiculata TaxID=3917 RepID=A0A4D6ME69_VIGUN|nr:hypothetical protein DEO72_LG7g319 [Vigna unguiculata]